MDWLLRRVWVLLMVLMCCGCHRHYLTVSQQWVDVNYLASTKVATPDPRLTHPPVGQMLVLEWFIPRKALQQQAHLELDLIFWDYTTSKVSFPIDRVASWVTYRCLDAEYHKTGGILTYKAAIVLEDGTVLEQWKHQLWVPLIRIGEDPQVEATPSSEESTS